MLALAAEGVPSLEAEMDHSYGRRGNILNSYRDRDNFHSMRYIVRYSYIYIHMEYPYIPDSLSVDSVIQKRGCLRI